MCAGVQACSRHTRLSVHTRGPKWKRIVRTPSRSKPVLSRAPRGKPRQRPCSRPKNGSVHARPNRSESVLSRTETHTHRLHRQQQFNSRTQRPCSRPKWNFPAHHARTVMRAEPRRTRKYRNPNNGVYLREPRGPHTRAKQSPRAQREMSHFNGWRLVDNATRGPAVRRVHCVRTDFELLRRPRRHTHRRTGAHS